MVDRTKLSDKEICELFVHVEPPGANTFELALALGGTVSAGAYTAGAVDFLVEALDEWTHRRDANDPDSPRHKVVLKVVTGTSGGGVNSAILARALAFKYPHVAVAPSDPAADTGNPFYEIWVKRLNFNGFLGTPDIKGGFSSVLDGKPIDEGALYIATFGADKDKVQRRYVPDPLTVILTLTNLRGIPYKTVFGDGTLSETFVDHADHARFAFVYPKGGVEPERGDEFVLDFNKPKSDQDAAWKNFSEFAKATAAFPLGFPPRALSRPTEHYRYRVDIVPPGPGKTLGIDCVRPRTPDWDSLIPEGGANVPDNYEFLTVDGGATDNEPIELARTSLAGVLNRNPRDGMEANRAVLLIDPFAGKAALGPARAGSPITTAGGLVSALTEQTRDDSSDLLLAADGDTFSRFMITPRRKDENGQDIVGGDAIAANGLGAFIGFACTDFMRHDYFLGRYNAWKFLKDVFVLPCDSKVMKGMWSDAQMHEHGVVLEDKFYLPIIPLLGTAKDAPTAEAWPKGALDPEKFRKAIERRYRAVAVHEGKQHGWFWCAAARLLAECTKGVVANVVIAAMEKALAAAELV